MIATLLLLCCEEGLLLRKLLWSSLQAAEKWEEEKARPQLFVALGEIDQPAASHSQAVQSAKTRDWEGGGGGGGGGGEEEQEEEEDGLGKYMRTRDLGSEENWQRESFSKLDPWSGKNFSRAVLLSLFILILLNSEDPNWHCYTEIISHKIEYKLMLISNSKW